MLLQRAGSGIVFVKRQTHKWLGDAGGGSGGDIRDYKRKKNICLLKSSNGKGQIGHIVKAVFFLS